MKTRFGGSFANTRRNTQFRYLAGALGMISMVLSGVIVSLLMGSSDADVSNVEVPIASLSNPEDLSSVELLVARQRLEEGTQLREDMFDTVRFPIDRIPPGGLVDRERVGISGLYTKEVINPGMPVLRDQLSAEIPNSALQIPPGFRAATMLLDQRAGVGGWATPNTRVDVLFTYRAPNSQPVVRTIVQFAKVLSVNGNIRSDGKPASTGTDTITLLVSELDAKKIELGRSEGTLSLIRVGDRDPMTSGKPETEVRLPDLLNTPDPIPGPPSRDGYLKFTDPKTGRQREYSVIHGKLQPVEE